LDFLYISRTGLFLDWLGKTKPCLTFGLRGISAYTIEVTGPTKDLHSGVFGGVFHEPLVDLIHIMSKLVDTKGKILIHGIYDDVAPLTGKFHAVSGHDPVNLS
jgi:Cys-Gly metallodipeptidase DUG1